jgi:CheY-like chemotaxis protein
MREGKVILVAEDDMMLRNMIRELLSDEGYRVLVASGGVEALALSRSHQRQIDLLLSDMEMSGLDGVSAYRQIRAGRPDLKILFMSGGMAESELPEPWPFLAKPFSVDALLAQVSGLLEDPCFVHDGSSAGHSGRLTTTRAGSGGRSAFLSKTDISC